MSATLVAPCTPAAVTRRTLLLPCTLGTAAFNFPARGRNEAKEIFELKCKSKRIGRRKFLAKPNKETFWIHRTMTFLFDEPSVSLPRIT
jgi:hypothetical protein